MGRQQELVLNTWGGARKGAGRNQVNRRKSEPHRERPYHHASQPVHVVLRVEQEVAQLRRRAAHEALRQAMRVVLGRGDFRIVHVSIQRSHVHLIVEADDKGALAKGMQAFQISAARKLNAAAGRTGRVFVDRYHPEVITNPRQAHHAITYVLNNWRKHDESWHAPNWNYDP